MKKPLIGIDNESSRKAWLKNTLASLPPGLDLLDVGAGQLANKKYCQHVNYISQDFCKYDGKGNNSGLQTNTWDTSAIDIVSDIANIPRPDGSFDVVLCTEVLEHVPDPVKAINEMCRLVSPGGFLIVTAPFCSLTHFAPYHYSSGFNRYFYEHHLQLHGFDIEEIVPNGNYYTYLAQEIRRVKEISAKYSNHRMGKFYNIVYRLMLFYLDQANGKDRGSNDLLCFGYQVKARKRIS